MMLVRPVRADDLDALLELAAEAGVGMTTMPQDAAQMAAKVRQSVDSFARAVAAPGDEVYLLVLQDGATGRLAGTAAIIAAIGVERPFYSYQVIRVDHTSRELGRYETVRLLQMCNRYRSTTEVATLYLSPRYRKDRNGRLLSRCRYLLMAEHPGRFSDLVMAEMRGMQDARGRSVFWDSLGRHFFDLEFSKADYLSALGNYQFIADLMPKYPIYVRLLPKAAQEVIGVTHEATRPALALLEREGFRFEGFVDVFDAGPQVHVPLNQIRTVRDSLRATVGAVAQRLDAETFMIGNCGLTGLRICRGPLRTRPDGTVEIDRAVAAALEVEVGDPVRSVRF